MLETTLMELDLACETVEYHKPVLSFRGGYASVHQGTLANGVKVAIKTGLYQYDESTLKSVICEARIWSELCHENIVPLLGYTIMFGASISLLSPWQEKGNAFAYIQDPNVDPRSLLLGIASGIDYLHSKFVVHGDIKGENVLIADDGRALLTDFGFASFAESVTTAPGRVGGTLRWMAPEVFDGAFFPESDVWSYGMTVLELFTRKVPFHDIPFMAVQIRIATASTPDRPAAEVSYNRLTDLWWTVCTKCWQLDASLRPSMSDILIDIKKAMSTLEPQ